MSTAAPFDYSSVPRLDVLVVAPHPDDAELGAGGAILNFRAHGLRVGVLDLTSGEPTPHGSLETRAEETRLATEVLQLDWRGNLGLPNRSLQHTLDARERWPASSAWPNHVGCWRPIGKTHIRTTWPPPK